MWSAIAGAIRRCTLNVPHHSDELHGRLLGDVRINGEVARINLKARNHEGGCEENTLSAASQRRLRGIVPSS